MDKINLIDTERYDLKTKLENKSIRLDEQILELVNRLHKLRNKKNQIDYRISKMNNEII